MPACDGSNPNATTPAVFKPLSDARPRLTAVGRMECRIAAKPGWSAVDDQENHWRS